MLLYSCYHLASSCRIVLPKFFAYYLSGASCAGQATTFAYDPLCHSLAPIQSVTKAGKPGLCRRQSRTGGCDEVGNRFPSGQRILPISTACGTMRSRSSRGGLLCSTNRRSAVHKAHGYDDATVVLTPLLRYFELRERRSADNS